MSRFKGHVDQANHFLISGWAICPDDSTHYPEIAIVQLGRIVMRLHPTCPAHHLRRALGLQPSAVPPTYAWRLWFPLSNGVKPDIPFSIVFASDNSPLTLGVDRRIELLEGIDQDAATDLKEQTFLLPNVEKLADRIRISLRVAAPISDAPPSAPSVMLNHDEEVRLSVTDSPFLYGKPVYAGSIDREFSSLFDGSRDVATIGIAQGSGSTRVSYHNSLRTLYIPKSVGDSNLRAAPVPELENICRVSGSFANADRYLVDGLTTFMQLNSLTSKYFGKGITDFPVVVDWGVGCARVMRHFFEARPPQGRANPRQDILGLDIDEVNIGWCRTNMKGMGRYEKLPLDGFRIESHSVDLLYGISVMTHLSEFHQHLWLAEISRILKPGGCAILTTHGEFCSYGEYARFGIVGIMVPFVNKCGFFDGFFDNAIGSEFETYYRATYHSRSYIRENWSRYLEILDVIPAANAFLQDFIVLRARNT